MNWLSRRKYRALLLVLVALVVVYPLLRGTTDERAVFHLFLTAVFLAAIRAIIADRSLRLFALLLGVPTVAGLWTGYALPGLARIPLAVGFHLFALLFFTFTVGVILREVYREKTVSADAVSGAFCGYLLTGLAFSHVYCVVESLHPGSFRGNEALAGLLRDEREQHFLLTYFSFLTLTTVGYGDITPASDAARGLAVVEAIVGQFYIAVLVAELIGKRVSQAVAPREADATPDGSPRDSSGSPRSAS
jgi:hypothetical protein